MPSAPSPTQAKNATSAMLRRVLVSSGSSGLPKSLRRIEASAMSARIRSLRIELLLDAARVYGHLFRRLLVALALGDRDAFAVRGERLGELACVAERLAEELPRGRIAGV